MSPQPLLPGDEIRVIAPSLFYPHDDIKDEKLQQALKNLSEKGYIMSFGENYKTRKEADDRESSPIHERKEDLMSAFTDKNVKAILPLTGGYNVNQLLTELSDTDFDTIKRNPKIFCGYSDITVLNNAIFAKTGMVTYSGPSLYNFGVHESLFPFTFNHFFSVTSEPGPKKISSSSQRWVDNDANDKGNDFHDYNTGFHVINYTNREAKGHLLGGNLCSFNLLQGTEYMPDLANSILFIEDDTIFTKIKYFLGEFERNLMSLTQQKGFNTVQGLLIGRFEKKSGITLKMVREVIKDIKALQDIPVIANLDFGHTSPMLTLPIGGMAEIEATEKNASITIL